jgi:PAS domain-containing protein
MPRYVSAKKTVKKSPAAKKRHPASKLKAKHLSGTRSLPGKNTSQKNFIRLKKPVRKVNAKPVPKVIADETTADERFRRLLEETDLGYAEMDPAGNFLFINKAGAANIGYTPKDMIGKNFRDFTTADEGQNCVTSIKPFIKPARRLKAWSLSFGIKTEASVLKKWPLLYCGMQPARLSDFADFPGTSLKEKRRKLN